MSWCTENLRDCQAWKDHGLVLSTQSNEAARLYDAAIRQVVSWIDADHLGGLEGTCKRMLSADPDFLAGKALVYGLDLLGTGKTIRLDAELAANIKQLSADAEKASISERERLHIEAVRLFSEGYLYEACSVWERILKEAPTDLLAVKFAHDAYFYLGNQSEIRDSVLRVLPSWKSHMPLYGHLKGMLAFGLEENNDFKSAEKEALEALEINRHDAWATHAKAHVHEMQAHCREGIRFLTSTLKDWTPCAMLACHNFWHLSLYHVEAGEPEVALGVFDREIGKRVESDIMLDIVDATSLLYRLQLQGVDVGSRWEPLADICRPHIDDHILTFNDVHLLMSFLGVGNMKLTQQQQDSLAEYVRNANGTNQTVTEKYGLPLSQAMIAYKNEDYATAADLILPIKDGLVEIGGSNAQRDVFVQLLIHSCLRSPLMEHKKKAGELILQRQAQRPGSALTERLRCLLHAQK